MSAIQDRETLWSEVFPGSAHTIQGVQPAVLATETALDLSSKQRQRTVWRIDGGGGSDETITWLLERGYQLLVNTPYTLAADTGVNSNGFFTYSLSITDGTTASGPSVSKTFSTIGTYAITLKVTDEEGKVATTTRSFYVVNPPVAGGMTIGPTTARMGISSSYTFGNLKDHDSLRIIWADGTSTTLANEGAAGSSATAGHTYATTGTKKLTVLVFKNGVQVDSKYNYVTVTL